MRGSGRTSDIGSRPRIACAAAARQRARGESGQSLVEFALILPLVVLLMAIAFSGWDAMQQTIRLTSAARAGAIQAAHDLSTYITSNKLTCAAAASSAGWAGASGAFQTAWNDATTSVNNEESLGVYQNTKSTNDDYVNMTSSTDNDLGVTIYVVTVTVSRQVGAWIPAVSNQKINATATARYC
jgi:Flp pilus assembly protein TadG